VLDRSWRWRPSGSGTAGGAEGGRPGVHRVTWTPGQWARGAAVGAAGDWRVADDGDGPRSTATGEGRTGPEDGGGPLVAGGWCRGGRCSTAGDQWHRCGGVQDCRRPGVDSLERVAQRSRLPPGLGSSGGIS
jgi:hypothetical protein